jgi:hypothetical protein
MKIKTPKCQKCSNIIEKHACPDGDFIWIHKNHGSRFC